MKVLLSSIGTRGDIQPLVALALELRSMGHSARLVVPPNFKEWIETYGLDCVTIGPDLKKLAGGTVPGKPVMPSPEQLQKMADESVRDQFRVIGEAVHGCDLIVAATALQFSARSIADLHHIPYVFVAYCPAVLPSPKYPPNKMGGFYPQDLPEEENLKLWKEDETSFMKFHTAINQERANLGLEPIASVRPYMFTERPWLAADPVLGPGYPAAGLQIVQTGAWILPDAKPLPEGLDKFLAAGAPPIFLGFGSMRATDQTARILVDSARALGLRAVLSEGWAGLIPEDLRDDVFPVGEVNYDLLLPRVAAIVHHGGAGTTHAAARAGIPQVIIPHNYDQAYWAHRLKVLGVGVQGPLRDELSKESLSQALGQVLEPDVRTNAQRLAGQMERLGVQKAANHLIADFGIA